ncbi:MAG: hypothetical protein C0490_22520, partial [Marivirga sp.]|nr:hypothetical protein [Marivirga sp.]
MRQQTTNRILTVLFCLNILSGFGSPATAELTAPAHATVATTDPKLAAFEVLKARCNACHVKQNPGKVFTSVNMNSLAPDIYEQVFIRKRMPR